MLRIYGGKQLEKLIADDYQYLLNVYKRFDLEIATGSGSYLYDEEGKKYLDLFSGLGVNALGIKPQSLMLAIKEQIEQYWHLSNYFVSRPVVELAKMLVNSSFADQVFFTNSGTEANEAALKLARLYGTMKNEAKVEVISFFGSFHGRTYGSLSLTGQDRFHKGFAPLLPGITYLPYNDIEQLKTHMNDKICAVFLEIIQGEGGIHEAKPEFLDALVKLAKQYDALIIVDDCQAGLGRTGDLFSYEKYYFVPDLLTMAKHLGGGLPLGAVLVGAKIAELVKVGDHGSTFGGNPLACRLGEVMLKTINQPAFLKSIKAKSYYLKHELEHLRECFPDIIKQIRGRGLMLGVEVGQYGEQIVELGVKHGLLLNVTQRTVLRLLPPLNISYEEIDEFISKFSTIIKEIKDDLNG